MKKVKAILTTSLNSVIPQDIYYPKLLHIRFFYSLHYYITILLVLTGLFTFAFSYKYPLSKLLQYKNDITRSFAQFPDTVILRIHKGQLTSNSDLPVFIWVKHKEKPLFVFMANAKDDAPRTISPIPFLFLKKDGMQISYRRYQRISPYDKMRDYTISKEQMPQFEEKINALFTPLLSYYNLAMVTLLPLVFIIFTTASIILSAAFSFLVFRIFFSRTHFKKCLQAGLHGTHIPMIISALLFILYPTTMRTVPIVCALYFVFTLVSIFEMYSKEAPHHRSGR
ncbi:MAG: DUF1189 family protein [Microgenomates group bacterium]